MPAAVLDSPSLWPVDLTNPARTVRLRLALQALIGAKQGTFDLNAIENRKRGFGAGSEQRPNLACLALQGALLTAHQYDAGWTWEAERWHGKFNLLDMYYM